MKNTTHPASQSARLSEPVTVSRDASPAKLNAPLGADDARLEIRDASGWLVATVWGHGDKSREKAEQIRADIIRACNAHAGLVAALEEILADSKDAAGVGAGTIERARKALAAAKEGAQ